MTTINDMTVYSIVTVEDLDNCAPHASDDAVFSLTYGPWAGDDYIMFHLLSLLKYDKVRHVNFSSTAIATVVFDGYNLLFNGDVAAIRDVLCSIINKHLQGDRDILLCQDELIEAGFAEWARL